MPIIGGMTIGDNSGSLIPQSSSRRCTRAFLKRQGVQTERGDFPTEGGVFRLTVALTGLGRLSSDADPFVNYTKRPYGLGRPSRILALICDASPQSE